MSELAWKADPEFQTDQLQSPDLSDVQRLIALFYRGDLIYRRVQAIELSTEGTTRRKVSIDFKIDETLKIERPGGKILLPITLVPKRVFRRLSISAPDGTPLSVLETEANTLLSSDLLLALAPPYVSALIVPGFLQVLVQKAITGTPEEAHRRHQVLEAAIRMKAQENSTPPEEVGTWLDMVKAFGESFLFAVEVDKRYLGKRTIIKYSFDDDFETPRSWRSWVRGQHASFKVHIEDLGVTKSEHIEVKVPEGLLIRRLSVLDYMTNSEPTDMPTSRARRSVGHVALSPTSRDTAGECLITAYPARQGIFNFSWIGLLVVTCILLGARFVETGDVLAEGIAVPPSATSILLLGPALFLSWMSRVPEPPLVASLLARLRVIMLLGAFVLVLLAGVVLFPWKPPFEGLLWIGIWIIEGLSLFLLVWFVVDPFHEESAVRRLFKATQTTNAID